MSRTVYVIGTESAGKTDLIRQIQAMCDGKVRAQAGQVLPTVGQEIVKLTAPLSSRRATGANEKKSNALEIRELGDSVSSSWVSFIEKRLAKDDAAQGTYALMFVVDATAPHMIPAAAAAFQQLHGAPGAVCRDWPALVVLQKTSMAHVMTKEEVRVLLTGGDTESESQPESVRFVEVDTWSGRGLQLVLDWLFPPSGVCE